VTAATRWLGNFLPPPPCPDIGRRFPFYLRLRSSLAISPLGRVERGYNAGERFRKMVSGARQWPPEQHFSGWPSLGGVYLTVTWGGLKGLKIRSKRLKCALAGAR
jgi:hypothetical protein